MKSAGTPPYYVFLWLFCAPRFRLAIPAVCLISSGMKHGPTRRKARPCDRYLRLVLAKFRESGTGVHDRAPAAAVRPPRQHPAVRAREGNVRAGPGRHPHRPVDPMHRPHQRLVPGGDTARSDDPSPFTKFVPEPHSGESHRPRSQAYQLAHLLFRDDRVELGGLRLARSDTAARRWCAPRLRLSGAASQDNGGRRCGRSWVCVAAIDRYYRS